MLRRSCNFARKVWPGKIVNRCGFVVKKVFLASPWLVIITCLFTGIDALEPILTLWIGKLLIDSIVDFLKAAETTPITWDLFRPAATYICLECIVALGSIGLRQYSGYVSRALSSRVAFRMRQEIYQQCMRLDFSFFEAPQSQDMMMRCRNMSVGSVPGMFNTIVRLAGMAVTMLGSLATLFHFSPALCGVALVVALPNAILQVRLTRQRFTVFHDRADRMRRGGMYDWFMTMPHYVKDTILLGLGDYFYTRWTDTELQTVNEDLHLAAKQYGIQAGMGWLARLAQAGAYAAIVVLTALQRGTIGAITMNLGLFQRAQGQVQGLSDACASLNNDAMFLDDYFTLMNEKPRIESAGDSNGALKGGVRSIEFQNVSFAYPGSEKPALDDVSFRMSPGESVFMAGRNGAGKTTIIKLLVRLYEPTRGKILINSHDICEIPAIALRKEFAVLMQDYTKYPFSARENVVVGDIEDPDNPPRVTRAIDAARFTDVLPKLPDGLETYVQKFFMGGPGMFKSTGMDLSGGEWQKLALARSFYRNSSVFILDEPTSALDVQTESEILSNFREHVRDKLAIIVSHRLSAAAVADRVIFVADGKIVEDGRHADLIQSNGPYAALFRMQQDGFAFL